MHIRKDRIKQSSISHEFIVEKFPSDQVFIEYFEKLRYPNGIFCPKCKSKQIYKIKKSPKQRLCGSCKNNFQYSKVPCSKIAKFPSRNGFLPCIW